MQQGQLKNKSEILFESANLLHGKNMYVGVGHCAYYCCFQLLKHILIHTMEISYDALEAERVTSKANAGSHEYLISKVTKHIKDSGNKEARSLKNQVLQLKRLRTDADYEEDGFDISKSQNAKILATDIRNILIKY